MTIYHGSDVAVTEPMILKANRLLDFGEGFYTTSSYEQACRWAKIVRTNRKSQHQIVSVYDFDIEKATDNLQIIRFSTADHDWLRFVSACRNDREPGVIYDLVMGPVANDNVYTTIQLFETGLLTEDETIIRLKVEKIFDQILFHTEKALNYCKYIKHEIIEDKNE
ncbi:MAG: DUF3990 domain-containing protein [Treponema sp.]|nr:DUF3990 domain-containing protein [Treponema sp.]